MLLLSLMLALVSIVLEGVMLAKLPLFRKMTESVPILGIIASLALSYALGHIFGAHGLYVMFAAIVSTAVTTPYYLFKARKSCEKSNTHGDLKGSK